MTVMRKPDLTITAKGKLVTWNAERAQKHWAVRQASTKQWRKDFGTLASGHPRKKFDYVVIVAQPWQVKGTLADSTAHGPIVKAAVDGLRDAGVIVDDSPKYVCGTFELAPRLAPAEALSLYVWEVERDFVEKFLTFE